MDAVARQGKQQSTAASNWTRHLEVELVVSKIRVFALKLN